MYEIFLIVMSKNITILFRKANKYRQLSSYNGKMIYKNIDIMYLNNDPMS